MGTILAIIVFVVGVAMFGIGIGGQVMLGRRRARTSNPGDRASARIVLTLAAIVVGAWMVIASGVAILHSHANAQQGNTPRVTN